MPNLRAATRDIQSAREAAAVAGQASRRARAGVDAVDALLAVIERGHLAGGKRGGGMRAEWRAPLVAAGLTVPGEVSGARNTVELHARLLDWQEELLSRRDPRRSALLVALDAPGPVVPALAGEPVRPREGRGRRGEVGSARPRRERIWACAPALGYDRDQRA